MLQNISSETPVLVGPDGLHKQLRCGFTNKRGNHEKIILFSLTLAAIASSLVANARADEVTDWNQTLFRTSLVAGFDTLTLTRVAAIALLSGGGRENTASVAAGIDWGQKVADEILAWRSTDGLAQPLPPFLGGSDAGMWRPTPLLFIPAVGQQFSRMTPWVIESPFAIQTRRSTRID